MMCPGTLMSLVLVNMHLKLILVYNHLYGSVRVAEMGKEMVR